MSDYTTLRGTSRRRTPAADHYSLSHREVPDDGQTIVHAGSVDGPPCPDCGRGHLRWAEAGYVSWHRICDCCGSHWDLHPLPWGPARPSHSHRLRLPEHDRGCDVYWEDAWSDEHGPRPCSCGAQGRADAEQAMGAELEARTGGLVHWVNGTGEFAIDPDERVSDEDGAPTWGEFLPLLRPEHWTAAEAAASKMAGMVVVPCCWARRARFS